MCCRILFETNVASEPQSHMHPTSYYDAFRQRFSQDAATAPRSRPWALIAISSMAKVTTNIFMQYHLAASSQVATQASSRRSDGHDDATQLGKMDSLVVNYGEDIGDVVLNVSQVSNDAEKCTKGIINCRGIGSDMGHLL
jgi:hypothetical protein